MGSKRKVFLYELATGKSIEFDSQTSAGEFIGVSESTIRKYNNTLKDIKGYRVYSGDKVALAGESLLNSINDHKEVSENINTNQLDSRIEELGYSKSDVQSVKTWQTQSGETRFSIVTKPDQVNSEEFLDNLKNKLSESIKPFEIKLKPARVSGIDLIVYTSDKHVGACSKDSQYDNTYNELEFMARMNKIYQEITYVKFEFGHINTLIFIDLGDNLDGYNAQTTRGNHPLPQNMTDEESFDTYVNVHKIFFDSLVENNMASEYKAYFVNDSNHSGSFGYTANRALEIYLNVKFPFIETTQMNKFMEHFILGDDCYILCHGKDKIDRKSGLPLHLNDGTYKLISDYIDYNKLHNYNVHFIKGDLHQTSFEKNSKFTYRNIPSVYGASKWIMNNFGLNKPGFSMDVYHMGNIYRRDIEL